MLLLPKSYKKKKLTMIEWRDSIKMLLVNYDLICVVCFSLQLCTYYFCCFLACTFGIMFSGVLVIIISMCLKNCVATLLVCLLFSDV